MEHGKETLALSSGAGHPERRAGHGHARPPFQKTLRHSDLHLLAKLDHATDGDLKIGGGLLGKLAGEGKKMLAPAGHAGRFARNDDLAAEEEGGSIRLDLQVVIGALTQKSRNVGLLHETKATRDTPEIVA